MCATLVDGDGGVDVLVYNRDAPVHLLMNRVEGRGEWIRFAVVDSGRDALGAELTFSLGDRTIMRRVRASSSYCAANDPRVHVGVPGVAEVTDVTVRWVDGTTESFGSRAVGQDWRLVRGEGTN